MSLEGATDAVRTFLKAIEEAQDMKTARATGPLLDEVVEHAAELLAMVEEEIEGLDRSKHLTLFAAVPVPRMQLERLKAELRGGKPVGK